jgi:hypothetical protein
MFSKRQFLVDTGSDLYVYSHKLIPRRKERVNYHLRAANGTTISTYGRLPLVFRGEGHARVEASSNTFTASLRVIGGNEKRTQCVGDINTGTWHSRLKASRI